MENILCYMQYCTTVTIMKIIEYDKILGMRFDEAIALVDAIKDAIKAHIRSS